MSIIIKSIDSISTAALEFLHFVGEKRVFAFHGQMGAGKTTFIKAICQALGVDDIINSPTFSIVNEYLCSNGSSVFHFDCYRIEDLRDAVDMGVEEYLYSGDYCFVEWPDNIAPLLPDDTVHVEIREVENGQREILFID